jgi:hypothetical protein
VISVLLFASRNLFLSILVLFYFLNDFTAFFFICSHFLLHHSFFLFVPFAPLTSISFFVVAFSITFLSSNSIFSTSCSSNLTFLVSSYTLLLLVNPIFLLSLSSAPPLIALAFLLSLWFVSSTLISRLCLVNSNIQGTNIMRI